MKIDQARGIFGKFIKTINKIKINCVYCNKELLVYPSRFLRASNKVTCNKECSKNYRGKISTFCNNCKKKIEIYRYRKGLYGKIFCNRKCKTEWMKTSPLFKKENNPRWNGGRYEERGYVYVNAQNHPNKTRNGYIFEHRLVMEKSIGRYLDKDEHIHHLNGIKNDNRAENLIIVNNKNHDRFSIKHALEERIRKLEIEIINLKTKIPKMVC